MNMVSFVLLFGALVLMVGAAFLGGRSLLRSQRVSGFDPADEEALKNCSCCGFRLSAERSNEAVYLKDAETGK